MTEVQLAPLEPSDREQFIESAAVSVKAAVGLAITIGVSFAFGGAFCGVVAICKSCG